MTSPYLANDDRLSDVIAAIQVMGVYRFYKLDFSGWADRISGEKNEGGYWKQVFIEHPEFFRLDQNKERASLVWRRQYPKRYHVDDNKLLSKDEYNVLSAVDKLRVSRNPLEPDTIEALVKTAIDLHTRALQQKQDKRWWIPLVVSFVGGLVGAIVGTIAGK